MLNTPLIPLHMFVRNHFLLSVHPIAFILFFIPRICLYFLLLSVHPLVHITIFLNFVTSTSIFLSFYSSSHLSIFFHAHIHTHDSSTHAQYLHTWILPHTFSPLSCLLQTVTTHTWSKNPLPINKGRVIKSLSITTTISTTYHYHFIDCPKSQLSALLAEVNSGPRHGYQSDRHITVSGSPSHDGQPLPPSYGPFAPLRHVREMALWIFIQPPETILLQLFCHGCLSFSSFCANIPVEGAWCFARQPPEVLMPSHGRPARCMMGLLGEHHQRGATFLLLGMGGWGRGSGIIPIHVVVVKGGVHGWWSIVDKTSLSNIHLNNVCRLLRTKCLYINSTKN